MLESIVGDTGTRNRAEMQTKKTWAYHAFQPGWSVTMGGDRGDGAEPQFKTGGKIV